MSKEFIWTDELVKEYIHRTFAPCDPNHQFMEQRMSEFKASHQPKEDKPEWEIVLMADCFNAKLRPSKDGMFRPNVGWGEFSPEYIIKNGGKILQVKRNSDQTVFSVGDETSHGAILAFKALDNGEMIVTMKELDGFANIKFISKKSKPKEERINPDAIQALIKKYNELNKDKPKYKLEKEEVKRRFPYIPEPKYEELKEPERNNDELVALLRDCVSATWGNPSLTNTQLLFDKFLHERKLAPPSKEYMNTFITNSVNEILLGKKYTQEQVNKMMEDAFNAGRKLWAEEFAPPKVQLYHETFQDYQSSLK